MKYWSPSASPSVQIKASSPPIAGLICEFRPPAAAVASILRSGLQPAQYGSCQYCAFGIEIDSQRQDTSGIIVHGRAGARGHMA